MPEKRILLWLTLITVLLVLPCLYLFGSLYQRTSSPEALIGGIGGLLGGILGALGAAWAVYLTLAGQRQEDRKRIRDAIVMEVIEFSRVVVGHLETCENIKLKVVQIPVTELKNILPFPTPIIYPAVAEKLGILRSPQKIAAFYTRLTEISIMADGIADNATYQSLTSPFLNAEHIKHIVEALLDICQFAVMIINDSGDESFDKAVAKQMLLDLDSTMRKTKKNFSITT